MTPAELTARCRHIRETCRKCGGTMRHGIALEQTYTAGMPDDVAIRPNTGGLWVLARRDGVVLRMSPTISGRPGRLRFTLACHCGGQADDPVDLARMRKTYAREERMNA